MNEQHSQLYKPDSHNYQKLRKPRSLKTEGLTSEVQNIWNSHWYEAELRLNPSKKQAVKRLELWFMQLIKVKQGIE